MEEPAWMTLTPSAVCAALATQAPTANMRLTPASPGPVCMGVSATPPTQGFNAPAGRASLGICVRWVVPKVLVEEFRNQVGPVGHPEGRSPSCF